MMQAVPDITIVGLGTGEPARRTIAAQQAVNDATTLFLRTREHPDIEDLTSRPGVLICDELVGTRPDGGRDWTAAAKRVADAAGQGPVVLAVPGHPRFGERLVIETVAEAKRRSLSFTVIDGLSVVDVIATALGADPLVNDLQIVDAAQLVKQIGDGQFSGGMFPFTPLRPMLFSRVYGTGVTKPLSRILQRLFPADHPVTIITAAGIEGQEAIQPTTVAEIAASDPGNLASLWVPALGKLDAVRDPRTLQHIVARLRAPDGCPWDRKQSHESLRDSLVDEVYEVLDAIDAGDTVNLAEELGDLFLLICMHAQIAEENGSFTLEDVFAGISTKIVRRHPHVFGDAEAREAGAVVGLWNEVKAQEKAENPGKPEKAADGQPHSMPALTRATRGLGKRPLPDSHQDTSSPEARSSNLLDAVNAIVAAGDDLEQVLRDALAAHVQNTAS